MVAFFQKGDGADVEYHIGDQSIMYSTQQHIQHIQHIQNIHYTSIIVIINIRRWTEHIYSSLIKGEKCRPLEQY